MAKMKKRYDDDDGRTVADMSEVSRNPLIVPRFSKGKKEAPEDTEKSENDFDWTDTERRAYIGGALGAALAIGAVFAVAGAVFIFLLTRIPY